MSTSSRKYQDGDMVWLANFINGNEFVPRQKAIILCYENGMYTGIVCPENCEDDGFREFSEDQIERKVRPEGGAYD